MSKDGAKHLAISSAWLNSSACPHNSLELGGFDGEANINLKKDIIEPGIAGALRARAGVLDVGLEARRQRSHDKSPFEALQRIKSDPATPRLPRATLRGVVRALER